MKMSMVSWHNLHSNIVMRGLKLVRIQDLFILIEMNSGDYFVKYECLNMLESQCNVQRNFGIVFICSLGI